METVKEHFRVTKSDTSRSSHKSGGKKKSKFLAYLLWLFGGLCGLHHFYLGRDIQGLLWWCTFGGYFGVGWFRDLFYIGKYVDYANDDEHYRRKMAFEIRANPKPPFSSCRFTGMVMVGYLFSTVVSLAIPEDKVGGLSWEWLHAFTPLAAAFGVWAVGNIGHETGAIKWPALSAYAIWGLGNPLRAFVFKFTNLDIDESMSFTIMILVAACVFDKVKKWRVRRKKTAGVCKRMLIISACCLLYMSLWSSYLYFNAKVTDENGEEVPFHEALGHFFNSPWWLDVKQSLLDVWNFAQAHGWMETWRQIVTLSDPSGEQNAFKVLGLMSGASQTEIKQQCKTLAVKYHPDKAKDEVSKKESQDRFFEVQQACELLSNSRVKRRRRNKQFKEEL
ncbi:dnaJ homolog subfamily C member 22 [Daktulosphaira vitifoliae]|uniref:dnaJ homolog subfamily C member 22 n=1 Tax=Daktulosphaira vitifoliae TaxID=58002 RepID=UPI0021AA5100|nr:dnaJ homolog subfamily C member 22 [Daktulosphaira vitifoliae]